MHNKTSSRLYYPNPFEPTGIEITLEEDAIVTLKIVDPSGNEVETLIDRQMYSRGKYLVPFTTEKYRGQRCCYRISIESGGLNVAETREIK